MRIAFAECVSSIRGLSGRKLRCTYLPVDARGGKVSNMPDHSHARGRASPRLRDASAAGLYYPRDEQELRCVIDDCLSSVRCPCDVSAKALIVPHAGYRYSGPVAAHAFAALGGARHRVRRVVIIGPSHRASVVGATVPASDAFLTPLGAVPIDLTARALLAERNDVQVEDASHALEHTIEVQLPFLQRQLRDFCVLPLLVGDIDEAALGQILEALWGGEETVILISSDLSQFNSYERARRLDSEACHAIERLAPDALQPHHACGYKPIRVLLRLARRHALRARTLATRNSGDSIGGPLSGVVGYGAFAFE
jgi:AmmeMemoRadiSam system protein B